VDVSFSPDVPAWVCYLVVLFFGALTGWREVIEKLGDPHGIWRHGGTWALMAILAVTPALLFWMLDRAGTVHDTSIVGAAIVGIAYTQILKGGSGYKAPGSTSPIWDFLSWWREQIGHSLQERAAANVLAFDRAASEELAKANKIGPAIQLAEILSPDPVVFVAALEAERNRLGAAVPPLAPEAVEYRLAEQVYKEIQGNPNGRMLMIEHKLIDKGLIYKYFSGRWRIRSIAVVGLAVALFFAKDLRFWNSVGEGATIWERVERRYLVNRLKKQTGTASDLARVSGSLMTRLNTGDSTMNRFWLSSLREPLRDPTVPMPRVDAAIQVMLAARDRGMLSREAITDCLLYALRNSNVDARRRIQAALVYLAHDVRPAAPQDLVEWNPTEGDAIPQIEQRIDQWHATWVAPPKKIDTSRVATPGQQVPHT